MEEKGLGDNIINGVAVNGYFLSCKLDLTPLPKGGALIQGVVRDRDPRRTHRERKGAAGL